MKYGQNLKLGDAHVTLGNIQEVQASKLGDARGTLFFINKISGHLSRHYFYYFICYVFFLEHQLFVFLALFCFVCCNKWLDHTMFVLERDTLCFHCPEHSSFHSFHSTGVLFF
jgi:hypothetical protein